jgi:3-hydroxybutyrate dehydrogenase
MLRTNFPRRLLLGAVLALSRDEAQRALLMARQPSVQFATPERIGGITVFLCSEAAARLRGASLGVDRGWTVQ